MTEEEKKQLENFLELGVLFDKITQNARNEVMKSLSVKEDTATIIRPKEIAKKIGCSRSHIYHLLDEGKILRIQINNKIIGTTMDSLHEYIEKNITTGSKQ